MLQLGPTYRARVVSCFLHLDSHLLCLKHPGGLLGEALKAEGSENRLINRIYIVMRRIDEYYWMIILGFVRVKIHEKVFMYILIIALATLYSANTESSLRFTVR